jgi:multiple sugar transport system substrate-binding protein
LKPCRKARSRAARWTFKLPTGEPDPHKTEPAIRNLNSYTDDRLNFSGERLLPSLSKLLDQPFWLDTSDPHRMAAVMQVSSQPLLHNYAAASGNWRHELVDQNFVWPKAIHRVAAEGISPEQAVEEAIARIKQILAE